jgi:transposase/predicted HicB family RNase H-like nuclease
VRVPDSAPQSTEETPPDLAGALALIEKQRQELREKQAELEKYQRENEQLRRKVDELCRKLFGKKSEKVDPDQLKLALEILEEEKKSDEPLEMDSGESLGKPRTKRKGTGRRQLEKMNLPVVQTLNDVSDEEKVCACCSSPKARIGEDTSRKLDYEPASLFIVETVTPRYACQKCKDGVVSASAPVQAIQKGMAGAGLHSYVVTSKYADHLPLHRLEGILLRQGVAIDRSTMCDWVGQVADALSPIQREIRRQLLQRDYLQTDETPVVILEKGGGSFKGRLWVYHDPFERQVLFEATRTREQKEPVALLSGFKGFLQADAYKGYDVLFRKGEIKEVACWAHARRKFVEARDSNGPHADAVLRLIQEMYQVEKDASEKCAEERYHSRQQRSVPLLKRLDELRKELALKVLPKSPMGGALGYMQNQWAALNRFVEDGRLLIDNNNAERALRHVAVGRKNWLFAARFEGAERAATLYSLVASCRLQDVDPFVYFRDVLVRVATHPQSRIPELTPKNWKKLFGPGRQISSPTP